MRMSIAAKIFSGFTAIILLFGGVSGYSLLRMHQIQEDLRFLNRVYLRLNEAYIQLNLLITEVHTLQNNLINLLGALPEDRNPVMVTRWIKMARNHRIKRVKQGIRIAKEAETIELPHAEAEFIKSVVEGLKELETNFRKTDKLYELLFEDTEKETSSRLPARVQVTGSGLRRRERTTFGKLRTLSNGLRRRLSNNLVPTVMRAAGRLETTENRAFYATMAWAVLALIVGVIITWGSQLTLRPLKRLADGARRIGEGEYGLRVKMESADEVGALAKEFNVMAGALQEREHRLIETERKAARAQRMAVMGRLAAQITHEIRNPLSSISLNAEMLEEEIGQGSEGNDALKLTRLIQDEVDRLAEITEEYLQFARMPRLKLEREDVGDVVRSLVSLMTPECRKEDVVLKCDVPQSPVFVMIDENQFRRALLNILKNAREALATGGEISIEVNFQEASESTDGQGQSPGKKEEWDSAKSSKHRAATNGKMYDKFSIEDNEGRSLVLIRITDNGPGIAEEKLSEIFEPFFSTKDKGTGLGLSITQQILMEHGAGINVIADDGRGTTFEILIPAA